MHLSVKALIKHVSFVLMLLQFKNVHKHVHVIDTFSTFSGSYLKLRNLPVYSW